MPNPQPKPIEKFESLAERRIREAQAEGQFDSLPGFGKPIPNLDGPDDENWWIKNKLRQESLVVLPPILEARRDTERTLEAVRSMQSEHQVRVALKALNERIRAAREHPAFMRLMARTATGYPVALGLCGNLAVERRGPAAGRLDVKRSAIVPLVNLVRFHALANRITISPTVDRIEAVASVGGLERGFADALERSACRPPKRSPSAGHPIARDGGYPLGSQGRPESPRSRVRRERRGP